jgi:cystathionine beta-lyase
MASKATICTATKHDPELGIVQPIQTATAYHYLDSGPVLYPRYFNTRNQESVAAKIAELENAEAGIVFGSGMAAICTTILAFLDPSDHVVFLEGLYGGTRSFIASELDSRKIAYSLAGCETDRLLAAANTNTRLIYVESPTNPCLEIVDLSAVAEFARKHNILTVIDNTFASPINQNPLDFGFDLVLHSGTKYLGGHSDLTCGAVVGNQSLIERIRERALVYGGTLNPLDCYLLDRSIKTLAVRMGKHNTNAHALAEYLQLHKQIKRVRYPGLPSHPGHSIAARQMSGFGGMLSFELDDSVSTIDFLKALRVVVPAISLGGTSTTVCLPSRTSHHGLTAEQRRREGISDQLIRCSVGIEDLHDLICDLEAALETASQTISAI